MISNIDSDFKPNYESHMVISFHTIKHPLTEEPTHEKEGDGTSLAGGLGEQGERERKTEEREAAMGNEKLPKITVTHRFSQKSPNPTIHYPSNFSQHHQSSPLKYPFIQFHQQPNYKSSSFL